MSNNKSSTWVKDNLTKAKQELYVAEYAYKALKNKETQYAIGIKRIIDAKRKVVEIWESA